MVDGSCGATTGAKTAASTKVSATSRPTTASGMRRKRVRSSRRRRARGLSSSAGAVSTKLIASGGPTRDADARVQVRVEQVDGQVDDDVPGRRDEDDALEQRVVALVDRVDRQPPESGDAEDLLGDDGAGDQCAELQSDHRRQRDERIAQRVLADHRPLRESFCARGAEVVRRKEGEKLLS